MRTTFAVMVDGTRMWFCAFKRRYTSRVVHPADTKKDIIFIFFFVFTFLEIDRFRTPPCIVPTVERNVTDDLIYYYGMRFFF